MTCRRFSFTPSVALVIALTLLPILNWSVPHVDAAPSQLYNFRDDFSYSSISSMINARWVKCAVTPDSYYAVSGGILSLQNDGSAGASICHNTIPQGVSEWNVTERISWAGQNSGVTPTGTLQVVAQTTSHVYTWAANGFYHYFDLYKDSIGVVGQFSYYRPDQNWHIMTMTMWSGTISLYFDKLLIGTYPEDPNSSNELIEVYVQAAWQTNNNFDYIIINGIPAPPKPDFAITSSPTTASVGFGQNATFTITLKSLNNFGGAVQLSPNIAPLGTPSAALILSQSLVSIAPNANANSTLLIQTYLLPGTGNYAFNVNATSSSIGHHATILLTVAPLPSGWDFSISVNPITIPVFQNASNAAAQGRATATLTSIGGFTANVALTAQFNTPPIVNYTFRPSTLYLSPGNNPSSRLTINFPAGWTWNGISTVTITGSTGGLIHSVDATVIFQHSSIIVTLSRHALVLKTGTSGNTIVTFQNNSTLTYNLSYSARIVNQSNYGPVLVWIRPTNPVNLGPQRSYSVTLEVQVPTYTPPQQYTIDLEVFTDTGLHWNQTIPLYVTLRNFSAGVQAGTWATYDFSISSYPAALTAKATVISIDGSLITYQTDLYVGGIAVNSTTAWIDIGTGEQSPGTVLPSLFIAQNQNAGQSPYLTEQWVSIILEQSDTRLAGAERTTMGFDLSRYPSSISIRWDRSTGLLGTVVASAIVNNVFETVHYTLTNTNAWTGLSSGLVVTPVSGQPLSFSFEANPSGGEPAYSYHWDFGDGATSAVQKPSHVYTKAGNYTVTLTVTDAAGNTETRTRIVNAQGLQTSQTSRVTIFPVSRLPNIPLNLTTSTIIAGWIIIALVATLLVIRADHRKRKTIATRSGP